MAAPWEGSRGLARGSAGPGTAMLPCSGPARSPQAPGPPSAGHALPDLGDSVLVQHLAMAGTHRGCHSPWEDRAGHPRGSAWSLAPTAGTRPGAPQGSGTAQAARPGMSRGQGWTQPPWVLLPTSSGHGLHHLGAWTPRPLSHARGEKGFFSQLAHPQPGGEPGATSRGHFRELWHHRAWCGSYQPAPLHRERRRRGGDAVSTHRRGSDGTEPSASPCGTRHSRPSPGNRLGWQRSIRLPWPRCRWGRTGRAVGESRRGPVCQGSAAGGDVFADINHR